MPTTFPKQEFLLNVGLTRPRVPTAPPEDDRGEKAQPRRYAPRTTAPPPPYQPLRLYLGGVTERLAEQCLETRGAARGAVRL